MTELSELLILFYLFFAPLSVLLSPEWPLWKSPVSAAGVSLTDVRVHV